VFVQAHEINLFYQEVDFTLQLLIPWCAKLTSGLFTRRLIPNHLQVFFILPQYYKHPLSQSYNSDEVADIQGKDRWTLSLAYNF
jgi:hypothetical protein